MKLVGNITSGKLTDRDVIGIVEPVNQWSHHKSVHLGVPEMLQGVRIICRIPLAAIDFDTQHQATFSSGTYRYSQALDAGLCTQEVLARWFPRHLTTRQ